MPKLFLAFILSICFFMRCEGQEKIEVAICAIFQNEARYLAEWIDFHHAQGVDKFYLYNNLSKDNFREVLKPYIQKGLVILVKWNYTQKGVQEWNNIQCSAYMHCIERIRSYVKWCAFIDTDEFLFCPDGQKLPDFLKNFPNVGGVVANWVMYGTSNVPNVPKGVKMTDLLTYRTILENPVNLHVKSIVQPKYVENCRNPHYFFYNNNKFAVSENKERIKEAFVPYLSIDKIRINHYWSRDMEFFITEKCARQKKWFNNVNEVIKREKALNVVYDPLSNYIKS